MDPGPVQRPRLPLTLAAHGPVTMKFASRHADSWNHLPSSTGGGERLATVEECLGTTFAPLWQAISVCWGRRRCHERGWPFNRPL